MSVRLTFSRFACQNHKKIIFMFCLPQKEGGKRRSKGEFNLKTKKPPEKNSPTMRYKEEKKKIKENIQNYTKLQLKQQATKPQKNF